MQFMVLVPCQLAFADPHERPRVIAAAPALPGGQAMRADRLEAVDPSAAIEVDAVIEEVEAGFRLGERLVRPAKVIVAMAAPETTEDIGGGDDSDKSEDEAGQNSEEN